MSIVLAGAFSIGTLLAQTTTTTTTTTGGDDTGSSAAASGASGEIGVRYMPTFSSFKLRQPDGSSLKADFVMGHGFGGFVAFNFTDMVGIQGELMYTALAQKYQGQYGEREVHLNYVNIPVLLSLNTGKSRAVNFNVVAGPQFGVNVGGKATTAKAGDAQDSVHTVVSARAGDVGFAYGAGVDFGFGPERRTRLGVGFRGVYGLIDISNKNKNQVTNDYYILDRTHVETYAGYVSLSFLLK